MDFKQTANKQINSNISPSTVDKDKQSITTLTINLDFDQQS
jgi:hypothetical protein